MKQAERLARIATLEELTNLYEVKRKAKTLAASEAAKYRGYLEELAKLRRIERGWNDIMDFAKLYFESVEPPFNLLDVLTPSPAFHFDLTHLLRETVTSPKDEKVAIAAPRSHAKSTIANNILNLWIACYADDLNERYWICLSEKQDGSRKMLDVVKEQIEGNPLLKRDFGDLKGNVWNSLEITTSTGVKFQAAGAGEALRGLRFGPYRPNVICDDIESDETCASRERVERFIDWFDKVVAPLGNPKTMKIILIGTLISNSSLLGEILTNRPDWRAVRYQALAEMPENLWLWDKWEEVLKDRSEGNNPVDSARIAGEKARQFYLDHKDEMDAGAILLWPARMDLYSLMYIRATRRLSFLSEYMNISNDDDTTIFKTIRYYDPRTLNDEEYDYYYGCDPSMGRTSRADASAIITVAKHRRSGYIYVVDVDVRRRHPDQIITDLLRKASFYKYRDGCVETVAFQAYFRDALIKKAAENSVYLPCKEYSPKNVAKLDRVAAIEPIVSNYVFFLPSQTTLLEQLALWPKSPRRDAADALCMVLSLIQDRSSSICWGKL